MTPTAMLAIGNWVLLVPMIVLLVKRPQSSVIPMLWGYQIGVSIASWVLP